MTFRDWLRNAKQHLRQSGLRDGGRAAASEFYTGAALRIGKRTPHIARTNIYDRSDWDVCIVLDACRYDAFTEVAGDYAWIRDVKSIRSTGSMSEEWMEQSFTEAYADEMAETVHVTWNAYASHALDAADWHTLDQVWQDGWSNKRGLCPPEIVTERGVHHWREGDPERLIVHYQQPHAPYRQLVKEGVVETLTREVVGDPNAEGRKTVWKALRRGEISREHAWRAYLDNLQWVLEWVDALRRNLPGADDVVLTADHGDCFGEYRGIYGHPRGLDVPELVKVPWTRLAPAEDHQTIMGTAPPRESTDTAPRERLAQLGYLDAEEVAAGD